MQACCWWAAVVCLAVGCVTIEPKAEFGSFPERFDATQVVTVTNTGRTGPDGKPLSVQLVASVQHEGDSLSMTFADSIWQTPLLKVSWSEGNYSVKRLIDGVDLPFAPEEIVDAAREVYRWTGTLDESGKASFDTLRFKVRLENIDGHGVCLMPKKMLLRARMPDGPEIGITTKDWDCAPDVSKR